MSCNTFYETGRTGKVYLINAIQKCIKLRYNGSISVATFAIASRLIKVGRTANSVFKIPVSLHSEDIIHTSVNSNEAQKLLNVSLIIENKILMRHRHYIKALDHTLKDIM